MKIDRLSLAVAGCFLAAALSAQNIVRVNPVSPLTYEQQDGHLKVLSGVILSSDNDVVLYLDGKVIPYSRTSRLDSLTVWMPMVGGRNVLECRAGGRLTCSVSVAAPVSSDWGYFQKGEIHLLQGSHQDIAWMDTPDYCRRERIEDIIIPALEMMKTDPDFTFEMEQTLNLMEFLEAYPDRKDEVIMRYKEGRFLWGATYNQPYEGLSSGEQLVRQTYFGRKWIRENLPGCDDFTASNMDVPGRALQMPQILKKSGIKRLFISRQAEGLYDWTSPDGTSVLTYSLGHYGFEQSVLHFFDRGVINAFNKVHERLGLWNDYYATHHLSPCYAVLMSSDAAKPDSYSELINAWNDIASKSEIPLPVMKYSTTDTYLGSVVNGKSDVPDIYGERPDLWLYIHGPAHYDQTLDKREASVLLPAAEFYSAIAYLNGGRYPKAGLDRAWMASIYPDHGLGGKNGEITDAIFADSLAVGKNVGKAILRDALEEITSKVNGDKGDIVVYNDLAWDRTSMTEVLVKGNSQYVVKDCDNKVVPSETVVRGDSTFVRFMADVPSMGYSIYKAFPVRHSGAKPESSVRIGNNYCSNAYYDMVLGDGGIVSLFDKQLEKDVLVNEKFALGDIIDAEYQGNGAGEFLRITDLTVPAEGPERSGLHASDWHIVSNDSFSVTYENLYKDKFADIVQRITMYHGQKKIDFDIRIENFTGEHNRQYRIMFPLNMKTAASDICYEVPMAVSHVGKDELDMRPGGYTTFGSYLFHPSDSHPREILNFISANGNGFGFTMSSCVAVADWQDPSIDVSDYPVLQGVLLSSHKSCHWEGNWYHQTGTHEYHFSITTHPEGWKNGYASAVEEHHPLHTVIKQRKTRDGSMDRSLLRISDPFVSVSAFKKADNEDALVLRLVEMEGVDKNVEVKLPVQARKVVRCNLIEDDEEVLPASGSTLKLSIGHNSIETYKIYQ